MEKMFNSLIVIWSLIGICCYTPLALFMLLLLIVNPEYLYELTK